MPDDKADDKVESKLGHHDHKLELTRTITAIITAITGFLVFLRVFHVI